MLELFELVVANEYLLVCVSSVLQMYLLPALRVPHHWTELRRVLAEDASHAF